MIRKLTIALVGAMTATALLLAGCAGGTTTEPEQPADQPSQPAASPSEAGNPSEQSQPSEGGDDGAKPSKEEIVTGLIKYYQSTQGLSESQAKKFAECMVDELYDKAKTKTLIAMRDGIPTQADQSDAKLFAEAGVACASALA